PVAERVCCYCGWAVNGRASSGGLAVFRCNAVSRYLSTGRRPNSWRCASSTAKPAAQEIADVFGAAIGDRVADVVRQAVIGPQLDVRQFAERFVIADRADGLAARHDDQGRTAD